MTAGRRRMLLSELVKARLDPLLKQQVLAEARRTHRSEGAVVRAALRDYFERRNG